MQNNKKLVVAAFLALVTVPLAIFALRPEIPNKPPERLLAMATHVVVGDVVRVYSVSEKDDGWNVRRYVAELRVSTTEKGEALPTDEPVFVRWFTRSWRSGPPPASSSGHHGWTPEAGDRVRVYLAQNAHDGFHHKDFDGGLNVLVPNGFEEL